VFKLNKEYWQKYYLNHKEKYNAYNKQWRKDHKEQYKIQTKNHVRELRLKAIELLGNKCVNPYNIDHNGFEHDPDYIKCLQIDHIHGKGNQEFDKLHGSKGIYRRVIKHKEDYQLLCANCNWLKRWKNKEM
jgi:hypothetical protein